MLSLFCDIPVGSVSKIYYLFLHFYFLVFFLQKTAAKMTKNCLLLVECMRSYGYLVAIMLL